MDRSPRGQSAEQITPSAPKPGPRSLSGPENRALGISHPPHWKWYSGAGVTRSHIDGKHRAGLLGVGGSGVAMKVNLGKEFRAHLGTSSEGWSQSGCL